jgi:hypothetical protein
MVAFLFFLRLRISSMRLTIINGPCFSCGGGRTHIQRFQTALRLSPFILHNAGKKSRGAIDTTALRLEIDTIIG